eukprot:TRINITY_DN13404_c0_g2_i2.p2 TRINITY_DN13404_c0_g2~~TRINITY_DN13404_c0_g2_i2.p2  ORF type:complete len:177 (+),score=46.37 TRINITY_DN13404_c0_g2_i2:671-1201(+)
MHLLKAEIIKMTERLESLEKEKEDACNSHLLVKAKLVLLPFHNHKDMQLKVNEQLRNEIYMLKKQSHSTNSPNIHIAAASSAQLFAPTRNHTLASKYQTLDYIPRSDYSVQGQDYEKQLSGLQVKKQALEDRYNKLMYKGAKTVEQRKLKTQLEVDIEKVERDINALKKTKRLAQA